MVDPMDAVLSPDMLMTVIVGKALADAGWQGSKALSVKGAIIPSHCEIQFNLRSRSCINTGCLAT